MTLPYAEFRLVTVCRWSTSTARVFCQSRLAVGVVDVEESGKFAADMSVTSGGNSVLRGVAVSVYPEHDPLGLPVKQVGQRHDGRVVLPVGVHGLRLWE